MHPVQIRANRFNSTRTKKAVNLQQEVCRPINYTMRLSKRESLLLRIGSSDTLAQNLYLNRRADASMLLKVTFWQHSLY